MGAGGSGGPSSNGDVGVRGNPGKAPAAPWGRAKGSASIRRGSFGEPTGLGGAKKNWG